MNKPKQYHTKGEMQGTLSGSVNGPASIKKPRGQNFSGSEKVGQHKGSKQVNGCHGKK